jgi:signal peptidase I
VEEIKTNLVSDEAPGQTKGSQTNGVRLFRFIADILETLVLSVVLFVGVNYITARIRVDGSSMEPTLHSGQLVLVNRLAYRFGPPARGDVIVFFFPPDPDQEYIKRLIGLPGDHVMIQNGQVRVNGGLLAEPYIAAAPNYTGEWAVPDGQYFVLGDNRNNSSDSHQWGMVPDEYVVGKALAVYWPPEDWAAIPGFPHTYLTP